MKTKLATLAVSGALLIPAYNPGDVGRDSLLRALRHRGQMIDEKDAEIARLERKNRRLNRIAYRAKLAYRRTRRSLLHQPSSVEALQLAAIVYRLSYPSLYRRASCESTGGNGLNARAHNKSGATGLLQILFPSTWHTTPYRGLSPYSPYANALAGGYMLAHGRAGEWVCGG